LDNERSSLLLDRLGNSARLGLEKVLKKTITKMAKLVIKGENGFIIGECSRHGDMKGD